MPSFNNVLAEALKLVGKKLYVLYEKEDYHTVLRNRGWDHMGPNFEDVKVIDRRYWIVKEKEVDQYNVGDAIRLGLQGRAFESRADAEAKAKGDK